MLSIFSGYQESGNVKLDPEYYTDFRDVCKEAGAVFLGKKLINFQNFYLYLIFDNFKTPIQYFRPIL